MRRITLMVAALAALALAGCHNTKPDPNYDSALTVYLKAQDNARIEREALRQNIANVANNCPKADAQVPGSEAWAASCVERVSSNLRDLALFGAGGNGGPGSATPQMPAYQRPPSAWREFAAGTRDLLQGVTPLAGIWQADRSNDRLADVQIETARINADREIAITGAWRDTAIGVTNVFAELPPSLQVEGGYIAGDVSGNGAGIGTTFTDDSTSAGNDVIGGDQTRDSFNGDNRDYSPGPYTCTPTTTGGTDDAGGGAVTCQSPGG